MLGWVKMERPILVYRTNSIRNLWKCIKLNMIVGMYAEGIVVKIRSTSFGKFCGKSTKTMVFLDGIPTWAKEQVPDWLPPAEK